MFTIRVKKDGIKFDTDLRVDYFDKKTILSDGVSSDLLKEIAKCNSGDLGSLFSNSDLDNFIVFIVHKNSNILQVFNDHFGSNEIYYKEIDGCYTVTDTIKVLSPSAKKLDQGLHPKIETTNYQH